MMTGSCSTEHTDEELACHAQAGCTASFAELVRRFQVPLLHFLRRLGAGPDAEDLLQETFLRAYRSLPRYEPQRSIAPWLFTIARRLRINHQRRTGPATEAALGEAVLSRSAGPLDQVIEQEDRERLWAAAKRILSEEEMTAVWLFYVEDMSAKEIAQVLERSWVSVKTMLFRARRRLLPVFTELERDSESVARTPALAVNPAATSRGGETNHV